MTSIWHRLGLESPTHDLKVIKRAYAVKLKSTRPDEDPEAFMALRQAFELAKNYVDYEEDEKEIAQQTLMPSEILKDSSIEGIHETPSEDQVDHLVETTTKILSDSSLRQSSDTWLKLLQEGLELPLDEFREFETRLRWAFLDAIQVTPDHRPSKLKTITARFRSGPAFINTNTAEQIFVTLGWNRWRNYEGFERDELLWLIYELGLKERSKPKKIVIETWQRDLRVGVYHVVIALGLCGIAYVTDLASKPDPKTHTLLPISGTTIYGRYEHDRDAGEYAYWLNGKNNDVKLLAAEEELTDTFDIQSNSSDIITVTVKIKGTSTDPEISLSNKNRRVPTSDTNLFNAISYLLAVAAVAATGWYVLGLTIKYLKRFIQMSLSNIRLWIGRKMRRAQK